jgi:hypothetical protein
VAESTPVTVTVSLTGDGLWDWVEANLESFKVSFVADVVRTLSLNDPSKVTDVTAVKGEAPAALLSDSQTVDVTFTLQPGVSNSLTPSQLGTKFAQAISNGTAAFSNVTDASGITVKASGGEFSAQTINKTTALGIFLICLISAVVCLTIGCILFLIRRAVLPGKANISEEDTTTTTSPIPGLDLEMVSAEPPATSEKMEANPLALYAL